MTGPLSVPLPYSVGRSILGRSLLEVPQKPRSRAEWEQRFVHWQRPASNTEEQKIEAAQQRVAQALNRNGFLRTHSWALVPQGSYHNSTNVRLDSDIDLCVCLTNAFIVGGPPGDEPIIAEVGLAPLSFTFSAFRKEVADAMREEFGGQSIVVGKKAIHIHENQPGRIGIDVVPAFVYRLYNGREGLFQARGTPTEGIAFETTDGRTISNFPAQHYANGCAKNDRTMRRYKRVVRIIKHLRNHMSDNPTVPQNIRNRAKGTSSFLIESLVYNCPDNLLRHPEIYDDVSAALGYLMGNLRPIGAYTTILTMPLSALWMEVNGIKRLFGQGQDWAECDSAEFISFVQAYMAT